MRREWEPEELIACWTLVDADWRLVSSAAGASDLVRDWRTTGDRRRRKRMRQSFMFTHKDITTYARGMKLSENVEPGKLSHTSTLVRRA